MQRVATANLVEMSRIITQLERLEHALDRLELALVERERHHVERLDAAFLERVRQYEAEMEAAAGRAAQGHDASARAEAPTALNAALIADRLDAVIARLERVLEQ